MPAQPRDPLRRRVARARVFVILRRRLPNLARLLKALPPVVAPPRFLPPPRGLFVRLDLRSPAPLPHRRARPPHRPVVLLQAGAAPLRVVQVVVLPLFPTGPVRGRSESSALYSRSAGLSARLRSRLPTGRHPSRTRRSSCSYWRRRKNFYRGRSPLTGASNSFNCRRGRARSRHWSSRTGTIRRSYYFLTGSTNCSSYKCGTSYIRSSRSNGSARYSFSAGRLRT